MIAAPAARGSARDSLTSSGVGQKVDSAELVSMYLHPPHDEVSIDEFEVFGLDRLQLLRGIDLAKTKSVSVSGGNVAF